MEIPSFNSNYICDSRARPQLNLSYKDVRDDQMKDHVGKMPNFYDDPFTPTHHHVDDILNQSLFPCNPCQIMVSNVEYHYDEASMLDPSE